MGNLRALIENNVYSLSLQNVVNVDLKGSPFVMQLYFW